jgi:hypothetical protein
MPTPPWFQLSLQDQGWTPEEVAEALDTSPTKVQAWRLGAVEMTTAERLALTELVRLKGKRTGA